MSKIIKDSKGKVIIIHGYLKDEVPSKEEIESRLDKGEFNLIPELFTKLLCEDKVQNDNGYIWAYGPNNGNLENFAKFIGFAGIVTLEKAKEMGLELDDGYSEDFEYYEGWDDKTEKYYYVITDENKQHIKSNDPLLRYGSEEGIYSVDKENIMENWVPDATDIWADMIVNDWNTFAPIFENVTKDSNKKLLLKKKL